jgi:molecular chaperone DnaK (HSP70)
MAQGLILGDFWMRMIFDPYNAQLVNLIKEQLTSAPKAGDDTQSIIMLVGGGSLIPYVQERVKEAYEAENAVLCLEENM